MDEPRTDWIVQRSAKRMADSTFERHDSPSGEAMARAHVRAFVRQKPLLAVLAAAAAGGLLGGVLMARVGRLLFAATVGFVAHDLWHREGRLTLADVLAGNRPRRGGPTAGAR
jgi:hypothetical protein